MLFKGCSPHQVLNILIGQRPQTATFHTTVRLNFEMKLTIIEIINIYKLIIPIK